ncbi:hypothetical protein EDC04DRAFT_929373 [Pisolithus marmoratus]|nr:hypothetical protein EDC04DRAFT_929373 [Pisolithus marmoratus]
MMMDRRRRRAAFFTHFSAGVCDLTCNQLTCNVGEVRMASFSGNTSQRTHPMDPDHHLIPSSPTAPPPSRPSLPRGIRPSCTSSFQQAISTASRFYRASAYLAFSKPPRKTFPSPYRVPPPPVQHVGSRESVDGRRRGGTFPDLSSAIYPFVRLGRIFRDRSPGSRCLVSALISPMRSAIRPRVVPHSDAFVLFCHKHVP